MALSASASLVQQFERLWSGATIAGLTDRQLLDRFIPGAIPTRKRRSRPWYAATGQWY